jgi:hypothetical protein
MENVVIPLVKSKWGNEILYSVRSWFKNFEGDFQLNIVGNYKPKWINGNINFKYIDQDDSNTTEENLSLIREWCINEFDEFIWTNDDIYLLNPINSSDIRKPLYLQDLSAVKSRLNNRWGRLLWKTADKLLDNGKTIYNGECHTPYYYNSENVRSIFRKYGIHNGSGLLRTAYINEFYDISELTKMQQHKKGFYSKGDKHMLTKLESMSYLNHDDDGLSDELKKFLETEFSVLSKYENHIFPNP